MALNEERKLPPRDADGSVLSIGVYLIFAGALASLREDAGALGMAAACWAAGHPTSPASATPCVQYLPSVVTSVKSLPSPQIQCRRKTKSTEWPGLWIDIKEAKGYCPQEY